MNGLALLLIGCATASGVLLRAVLRDGQAFCDRLADFDQHADEALSIVCHDDGCLTPDESYQWVLIVDGFGPRGSAA